MNPHKKKIEDKKNPKSNLSKIFALIMRFRATVAIALLLALGYFLLSQGSLFIPKELLVSLSFGGFKPLNLLSYMFAHMSIWHLALNLIMLLAFAGIVEEALSPKDVAGIFFFSGFLTVAAFSFFYPFVSLFGASGGVFGLMACAFVLKPKKALYALAWAMVLLLIAFPLLGLAVQMQEGAFAQANQAKESKLAAAIQSGNQQKIAIASIESEKAGQALAGFNESEDFASGAETSYFLHSFAAIFGIAYLLLFKRKETIAFAGKTKIPFVSKNRLAP